MRHASKSGGLGTGAAAPGTGVEGAGHGVRTVACLAILVGVWYVTLAPPSASADDAYYRALLPEILPPTPAPTGQPGLCDQLLARNRFARPQRMTVYADKPRQAAAAALRDPALGVTLAGYALSAGVEAEQAKMATCVDLYFEAVAFSWNFLKSRGASARPEYETAWQLYHHSLARLMGAGQRFGRLDPSSGLRVVTAAGALTIPTVYRGFAWKAEDFTRIEVVNDAAPRRLQHHYSKPGLGVPLVVIRDLRQPERFYNDVTPFGATVVLRPSLAVLAGTAPPLGADASHGPVEFYDPLRVACVTVGRQQIAMASNTSAALEYMLEHAPASSWETLMEPSSVESGQEKLFLLEPRQPDKYPLVFVHGFLSSPAIWCDIANELLHQPDLRASYQIMAYRYPTGRPFVESAAVLRRELHAFVQAYDPREEDPSIYQMAMIGHSMGGLVAKLAVTHSDDRLWNAIANRPLDEINASEAQRKRLAEFFYFQPVPYVRRVVFQGTPHDGAGLASRTLGHLGSCCIPHAGADQIEHNLLVKQNPDAFTSEFKHRIPTSIDMMDRKSRLLQAVQGLCPGEQVQFHNIIGTGCFSPLEGCGDGVVSVASAKHPCVSTEKQVHATHRGLHESDESIREILCILRRHVLEACEEPCDDTQQAVLPDCGPLELADPCPILVVPDACVGMPALVDPCEDLPTLCLPAEEPDCTIMLEGPVR